MTVREHPLCDCDEPCACYGYRQGQGLFRGGRQPQGPAPRRGLRLSALPGEAGLPPEGDDAHGPEFAGALRAGGGLDASITTTIHPIGQLMSGNFIAERKAAKLRCEWLVARSGCSGALSNQSSL